MKKGIVANTKMLLIYKLMLPLMMITRLTPSPASAAAAAAAAATKSFSLAKTNCTEECGGVIIPYPFGIGDSRCFRNPWYEVTCNKSSSHRLRPFLIKFNLELLEISLDNKPNSMLVNSPVFFPCRDGLFWKSSDFSNTPFSFSDINKLYNVGYCSNILLGDSENRLLGGCTSSCISSDPTFAIGCNGINCCQIPVSTILSSYTLSSTVNSSSTCSYAFLAVESRLPRNFSENPSSIKYMDRVPVSINWRTNSGDYPQVTDGSPNSAFSCEYVSYLDTYVCRCGGFYEGNPYIVNGCQVVEACTRCKGRCQKHLQYGSFYCTQSRTKEILIGGVMGGGAATVILIVFCIGLIKIVKRRRKLRLRQKFYKRNGGLLLQQKMSTDEVSLDTTRIFSEKELQKATDGFNVSRILGQGGQGTVYKGMLTDGTIVAIKKSRLVTEDHHQQHQNQVEQFINEVVILSQINHRNIVKLFGCCLETEVPLLVYEFISNGTLSQLIRNQEEFPFSWEMRLRIAAEVSGALSYLHSSTSLPIFHRDIKTSNILLDEKYNAKLADFGTSRSINVEKTHLTMVVQGTFGYLDPEFFRSSQFTDKSDVYSFGVVLAELLTGERAVMIRGESEEKSLVAVLISSLEQDTLFDIIDERVAMEGRKDGIVALAELSRSCLNLNGKQRPTMKQVMLEIERIRTGYMQRSNISKTIRKDRSISKKMEVISSTSSQSFSRYIESFEGNARPLLLDQESEILVE